MKDWYSIWPLYFYFILLSQDCWNVFKNNGAFRSNTNQNEEDAAIYNPLHSFRQCFLLLHGNHRSILVSTENGQVFRCKWIKHGLLCRNYCIVALRRQVFLQRVVGLFDGHDRQENIGDAYRNMSTSDDVSFWVQSGFLFGDVDKIPPRM